MKRFLVASVGQSPAKFREENIRRNCLRRDAFVFGEIAGRMAIGQRLPQCGAIRLSDPAMLRVRVEF